MARLSPTRFVIYGTRVPVEQTPIVEANQGSTVVGDIDTSIQGLTGIVSLSVVLNKLNAPTKAYPQYEVLQPDLYSINNTYYNYTGAGGTNSKISWRCALSGITGVSNNDLYGLSFRVNQGANINTNIAYQPDIVIHVSDPISKDAINE